LALVKYSATAKFCQGFHNLPASITHAGAAKAASVGAGSCYLCAKPAATTLQRSSVGAGSWATSWKNFTATRELEKFYKCPQELALDFFKKLFYN